MMHDDLPLFRAMSKQPDTAVVLAFPLNRRVGKIRRVAEVLSRKQGKDASSYWNRQCDWHRADLSKTILTDDEIENEVDHFFDAVQQELATILYHAQKTNNDKSNF